MVSAESTNNLPQPLTSPETVPAAFSLVGPENVSERPLFYSVGSTIVASPDFINLVNQVYRDRTKISDLRETLYNIAQGKESLSALKSMSEKHAQEEKPDRGVDKLQSAAEAVKFMGMVLSHALKARKIPFSGIWTKIVLFNGQPYAICCLDKPKNNFFETLLRVKKGQTDIPRYNGGVLDGYNGVYTYETDAHTKMGPLSYRLAAIVDSTRTEAFQDIMKNPQAIDIGLSPEENLPDGRLFTITKKIELKIVEER